MGLHQRLFTVAFFLGVTACGGGDELGSSCMSNSDCDTYSCVFEKTSSNSMCVDITEIPGTCSPACSTQADCRKFGASFSCALTSHDAPCNPTGVCLQNYSCTGNGCRIAPDN
jgi:hypothetical protein